MAKMEHKQARALMVSEQLVGRGITDPRVLDAMRNIPRHLFIPPSKQKKSYSDMAMGIGQGQTISQPYMVAIMTEMLALTGLERVLEVGTGSGYQSAVLAALAQDVYSIERIAELSEQAKIALLDAGVEGINLSVQDGTEGWAEMAPFDRILVTAATPEIPPPLLEQLGEAGILVAPVGPQSSQQLVKVTRHGSEFKREYGIFCVFVPLIGEHGF